MKKGIKVSLYSPYLDILGGGEKHIISILQVFAEMGAEISIFWNKDLSKDILKRYSFKFINNLKWLPVSDKNLNILSGFDYFFYVTDGSYFLSTAKKNYIFCMVPDRKLYNMNLLNRVKLWNYKFISNSPFTTKWLIKWGIDPFTIPPYIDNGLFKNGTIEKEKIILSVGRFFPHLHSKNQKKIIDTFIKLKKVSPAFQEYKLILVGGLKKEDEKYFEELKSSAENDSSIIFKPNVKVTELNKIYKQSTYYWHFTGLGIDENIYPDQVEHFGIAPLEAVASGNIAFCHRSGGPKEIFKDGINGILFDNSDHLITRIQEIEADGIRKNKLVKQGQKFVNENYSYQVFKNKVLKLL